MKGANESVIKRLIKRSLAMNSKRNYYIVTSIALTNLLIASIFSIGMSFQETERMLDTRMIGTMAHISILNPSTDELEQLQNLDYVRMIGTSNHVAEIETTLQMGEMNLSLHYFDETKWEEMRLPTLTNVIGSYPQHENEIMVPVWVLDRLSITPEIGTEIPLAYIVETNGSYSRYERVFTLSGWFKSYVHLRTVNMEVLLVSETLSQKYGQTVEESGSASIIFADIVRIHPYIYQLVDDLEIADRERIRLAPNTPTSVRESMVNSVGLIIIMALVFLTGYLLIYNVMNMSVAKDVRFYGLLKTIGASHEQIGQVVRGQIFRLCVIGIPLGLAAAALLSLLIVPAVINLSTFDTGAVVSFSPLIFLGAAVFSSLTALLGAVKPAKKAADLSPIEARKLTGIEVKKSAVYVFTKGKLHRMALRNIFRDRKGAAVVFLSLFLGVTTFITIIAIVASMDPDNFAARIAESDIVLTNNTVLNLNDAEPRQKFDEDFVEKIKNLPGVYNVYYVMMDKFYLVYNDGFEAHLQSEIEWMERWFPGVHSPEQIIQIKENFSCIAFGVDRYALVALDDIDIEAFEAGEFLLLSVLDPIVIDEIEAVEIRNGPEGRVIATVPVGGFARYPPFFYLPFSRYAPTLVLSHDLMEQLSSGAIRSKIFIDAENDSEELLLASIIALTGDDYEITRDSQIEWREYMRDAKTVFYILGGGMAVVLSVAGILNFVNVMSVGVIIRRREFAMLESIGMTRRQLRKMLRWEGIAYAIITLLLVSLFGNAITYVLLSLFHMQVGYLVFSYPIIPAILSALVILIVCLFTPEVVYRSTLKSTIVERLKEAE